jgi:hypothetical protein
MTQSSIQSPVTIQELLVSSLAQTDALAKLLIEKGLITREEFMEKIRPCLKAFMLPGGPLLPFNPAIRSFPW